MFVKLILFSQPTQYYEKTKTSKFTGSRIMILMPTYSFKLNIKLNIWQDYHKTSGSCPYYIAIRQVEEELQRSNKLTILSNVNLEVIIITVLMKEIKKKILSI